jgi:hypothetical protein
MRSTRRASDGREPKLSVHCVFTDLTSISSTRRRQAGLSSAFRNEEREPPDGAVGGGGSQSGRASSAPRRKASRSWSGEEHPPLKEPESRYTAPDVRHSQRHLRESTAVAAPSLSGAKKRMCRSRSSERSYRHRPAPPSAIVRARCEDAI